MDIQAQDLTTTHNNNSNHSKWLLSHSKDTLHSTISLARVLLRRRSIKGVSKEWWTSFWKVCHNPQQQTNDKQNKTKKKGYTNQRDCIERGYRNHIQTSRVVTSILSTSLTTSFINPPFSPLETPRFAIGYNVTIMAYGQTSSGKTYTMGTGAPSSDDRGSSNEGRE